MVQILYHPNFYLRIFSGDLEKGVFEFNLTLNLNFIRIIIFLNLTWQNFQIQIEFLNFNYTRIKEKNKF